MLSDIFEDTSTGTVSSLYILTSVEPQLLFFMSPILIPLLSIVHHGDFFSVISYHCQHSSPGVLGERG